MLRYPFRTGSYLNSNALHVNPNARFTAHLNAHSSSPLVVAIVVVAYVTLCMLILLFAGPNYAAELNAGSNSAANLPGNLPTNGPANGSARTAASQRLINEGFVDPRNPTTNAYKTEYVDWTDSARSRTLPVKLLIPAISSCASACPVILFSHGLGGSRDGGKAWGEYWASHGYFVVHLQHPGSDEGVWKNLKPADRLTALRSAANAQQLAARGRDVRFVIDELERRHAQYPMADLMRIGMSGHSFGASTTQGVAGEHYGKLMGAALLEPRIRAALAFSPSARASSNLDDSFGSITIPFMSITGTLDSEKLLGRGITPDNRVQPFEHMRGDDKYLIVLKDADHMLFNGSPGARDFEGDRSATLAIEPRAFELVEAATLAYWDATLKHDSEAKRWLTGRDGFVAMLGDAGRFAVR